MSVKVLMEEDHGSVLDQSDEIYVAHAANLDEKNMKLLQTEGIKPAFFVAMKDVLAGYRADHTDRENLQREYRALSEAAQVAGEEGGEWVQHVESKGAQVEARAARFKAMSPADLVNGEDPAGEVAPSKDAMNLARTIALGDNGTGTPSATRRTMDHLIDLLVKSSATAEFGFVGGFVERGQAIVARIPDEQGMAAIAKLARQLESRNLETWREKLWLMHEELQAARESVLTGHGVDLPGGEFALLRSAAARRVARAQGAQAVADAPTASNAPDGAAPAVTPGSGFA